MAEDDELLVMAASASNPLVQKDLAARLVHDGPQVHVLLLAEVALVRVGAPHQTPDVDPSPGELAEHATDLRPGPRQLLVGVPPPVGEHDQVAGIQTLKRRVEALEVFTAVHERPDRVPLRPSGMAGVTSIQVGVGVPSLVRGEEPVVGPHVAMRSHSEVSMNRSEHAGARQGGWERYPERR